MQDISRYGYGKWLNNKRQYEINMDSFLEEICSEEKMAQSLKLEKCTIPLLITDELVLYRRKILEFQNYFMAKPGVQYFEYTCFVGTGSFIIVWDISKVEKIINCEETIRSRMNVKELYEIIDKSGFEYEEKSCSTEKPPVIAYYKPFNTYVVIDGNHRIYDAYHEGKKELEVIVLTEEQMINALVNEDFAVLYKIHWNLQYIFNYLICNIDKFRYRNQDRENGMFILEDDKKELFRKRVLQWLLNHF